MAHVSWRDCGKIEGPDQALRCLARLRRPSPVMCPFANFTEDARKRYRSFEGRWQRGAMS